MGWYNGLIYDTESDGFANEATKITCIVTQDINSGEIKQYYKDEKEIKNGLMSLYNAPLIIAHNQIGHDIPLIKRLYPGWEHKEILDTYILSLLLFPERQRHSIESYAKHSKYDKVEIEDFSCLSYSLLDRCTLDVILNRWIYRMMVARELKDGVWGKAIKLEQDIYFIHQEQVRKGVLVDKYKINETILSLDTELEPLSYSIREGAPLTLKKGNTINKIFKKDGSYMSYVQRYIEKE